ncbi:MAG: sigma factor, ECF-like family protein, partial [Gemmatimonadetes bacterium]|nr:sigma factor, ECF-like family protein [Gemmatimonadota bacterium]
MTAPLSPSEVLIELRSGTRLSLDRIMPLVYDELRLIAHRQRVARGGGAGTLQTTGLVHEAYL